MEEDVLKNVGYQTISKNKLPLYGLQILYNGSQWELVGILEKNILFYVPQKNVSHTEDHVNIMSKYWQNFSFFFFFR